MERCTEEWNRGRKGRSNGERKGGKKGEKKDERKQKGIYEDLNKPSPF